MININKDRKSIMNQHPFYWVDAFTEEPFKGNPAAVCLINKSLNDSLYQSIATEIKLSETAFAEKIGESEYNLRWFTPVFEMPLCGHATLATAHILFSKYNQKSPISFHTKSGVLKVEKTADGIRLAFPVFPTYSAEPPSELLDALGVKTPLESVYEKSMGAYILLLKDTKAVESVEPNFEALSRVCKKHSLMGAIVTAGGSQGYDFVSRVFAPGAGVDEDPVTGLAHCMMATYWSAKLGKTKMFAYQKSKRGGELGLELKDDTLYITGKAITLIEGSISI
jgi:PhzF family phenazine biosynthesis protein